MPVESPAQRAQLAQLAQEISECRACPRLVAWREQVAREKRAAFRDEEYWARPVPGFGDPAARVVLVTLLMGSAILIPIARSNMHSVLFAAREASATPFRGADQ